MDNYVEWRQNKLYEGHISRLSNMQSCLQTHHPNTNTNANKMMKRKFGSKREHRLSKLEKSSIDTLHDRRWTTSMDEEGHKTKQSNRLSTESHQMKRRNIKMKIYFPAPLLPTQ